MHTVSDLYRSLRAQRHKKEIMVRVDGAEYTAESIVSAKTYNTLFAESGPTIGACVSGEIDLSYFPGNDVPKRMAKIEPFVRISDGKQVSEWIPKGVFYSDTRAIDKETGLYAIHGYDAMLKAEQTFISSSDIGEWPRAVRQVVEEIVDKMGIELDARTVLSGSVMIPYPNDLTCREILAYIAVAHGGNWIISDFGKLLLVGLASIPAETSLLVDSIGDVIRFGEVAILVG